VSRRRQREGRQSWRRQDAALPCRATVFDGKDGKLYVMRMNLTNLAKTLQGDLAKAMAEVGAEEEALYKSILE
jgi:uncharacterized protein (DUF302 family)